MEVVKKNDKAMLIRSLQKKAQEVKTLKKTRRQKRPIVIEFSGSPKAGKTSCINSLGLFLKRNGFRVKIIQERASVCPIPDKHSPMFNIWTSCMSITEMVGVLEQDEPTCDFLIIDRGIFDAFCWFKWLSAKGMLEDEQLKTIENFLLLDLIRTRIDIIFVFQVSPETSIQREYATLLTDKLGTIMNKKVLQEYLKAIENTIDEKSVYFQKNIILNVNTTDKTQDKVGQEVTEKTLDALKNLLMERIGFIKFTNELRQVITNKKIFLWNESINIGNIEFDLRDNVENNNNLLQPLPMAVLTNKERTRVLTVKKQSKAVNNDSPERDKLLAYIGGHPRYEDFAEINSNDFISVCRYALRREIKEELGVYIAINNKKPFLIYTPDNETSKKHLAICFILEVDIDSLCFNLDEEELITKKGTTKSGRFHDINTLISDDKLSFESWTIEIFRTIFNVEPINNKQLTLDDIFII